MAEERIGLDEQTPWRGEHLFRYHQLETWIKRGERVLDLACGSGYGAAHLAQRTGAEIVGGDLSSEAIALCRETWRHVPNLRFEQVDGTSLPYDDNHFDKIVSFETIEHTASYCGLIAEFVRVLKPGGQLFISTPNRRISSPDGVVRNPYHTQEFDYNDLDGLLGPRFSRVQILGQAYTRYMRPDFRASLGLLCERALLLRGIRKLPLRIQNAILGAAMTRPIYPEPDEFALIIDRRSVEMCPTLFLICDKKSGSGAS